jgi:hypothetical protein
MHRTGPCRGARSGSPRQTEIRKGWAAWRLAPPEGWRAELQAALRMAELATGQVPRIPGKGARAAHPMRCCPAIGMPSNDVALAFRLPRMPEGVHPQGRAPYLPHSPGHFPLQARPPLSNMARRRAPCMSACTLFTWRLRGPGSRTISPGTPLIFYKACERGVRTGGGPCAAVDYRASGRWILSRRIATGGLCFHRVPGPTGEAHVRTRRAPAGAASRAS